MRMKMNYLDSGRGLKENKDSGGIRRLLSDAL